MIHFLSTQLLVFAVVATFNDAQPPRNGGHFNLTTHELMTCDPLDSHTKMIQYAAFNGLGNSSLCTVAPVGLAMSNVDNNAAEGNNATIRYQSQMVLKNIISKTESYLHTKSAMSAKTSSDASDIAAIPTAVPTVAAASSTNNANVGACGNSVIVASSAVMAQVQIPVDIRARMASGSALLANVDFTHAMESALTEALSLPSGAIVTVTSISLRRLFLGAAAFDNGGSGASASILGANDVILRYKVSFPSGVATSLVAAVKNAASSGGAGSANFATILQSKSTQKLAATSFAGTFVIAGSPMSVGTASSSTVEPNTSASTMSGQLYLMVSIVFLASVKSFFFGVSWIGRCDLIEHARLDDSVDASTTHTSM